MTRKTITLLNIFVLLLSVSFNIYTIYHPAPISVYTAPIQWFISGMLFTQLIYQIFIFKKP